ncbi:hypothetical protein CRYUN_Cryun22dG0070600 [Craigia yunnanensis]
MFIWICRFGPSKRIQSCGYAKSAKNSYRKPTGHPVMNVETQASRSWSAYVVPAALLGFGGLVAFVHYNDLRRAVRIGQDNNCSCDAVAGPIIGGPFTLVNTENQIVNENNFLGNWRVFCLDQESKENFKVLPVFVTIDPQHDTLAQLRAYLKDFDPRIVGLTGPISAVRQMAQEYRIFFKKVEEEGDNYLVESSNNMYLIDPKMKVLRCFGVEYNAEELSKEILKELKKC